MNLSRELGIALMAISFAVASCHGPKEVVSENINTELQEKYAQVLGVPAANITNQTLYTFVDDWLGTPYAYGGTTQSGVDCSGFSGVLYSEVYGQTLTRRARDIYDQSKNVKEKDLQEGDFVFFKIESSKVSHMGIYLQNGYFIHASSSRGVVINNLTEDYYAKYFYKGGRLPETSD